MQNGIINIYKEKGYTSHDVVAKLRGILHQKKIGHTGTLDPDATGVLLVCLGKGTKLCDMITDKDKTYRAQLILGITTDTQDISGTVKSDRQKEVMEKYHNQGISDEQIRDVIESFVGPYMQVPPMYSALKVNGKKLYELARQGKEVERKARLVQIYHIKTEKIEFPYITMEVSCSKGTYIRTLCEDIGEKLKTGACMGTLERTGVGKFRIEDAVTLAQVEEKKDQVTDFIIPVDAMFETKSIVVRKESESRIYNGNIISDRDISEIKSCDGKKEELSAFSDMENVKVYNTKNEFVAVYQYRKADNIFKIQKMFYENTDHR